MEDFCIVLNKKLGLTSQPAREECRLADWAKPLERCLKQRGKTPQHLKSYIFFLFEAAIPGHLDISSAILLVLRLLRQLPRFSSHVYHKPLTWMNNTD